MTPLTSLSSCECQQNKEVIIMNYFIFTCGNCQTEFPIKIEVFQKRIAESGTDTRCEETDILCPSCFTRIPYAFWRLACDFAELDKSNLKNWEMQTVKNPPYSNGHK